MTCCRLSFDGEADVIIPSRIPIPTTKEESKRNNKRRNSRATNNLFA
jgi:hypothetical protein